MSRVNLKGYEAKTELILNLLAKLMHNSYSGQSEIITIAKKISHECETLLNFLSEPIAPSWIKNLKEQSDIFCKGDGKSRPDSFKNMFLESTVIRTFDWNKFFEGEQGSFLDFDALYVKYKKESKLDEALDKIINCLEAILAEASLSLKVDIRENIQNIINTIRQNKNASFFAVHATVLSAKELLWAIAKCVPKLPEAIEVGKKFSELLGNTYDAIGELYIKLNMISQKVNVGAQSKLFTGFTLPPPVELKLGDEEKKQLLIECGKDNNNVTT